MKTIWNKHFDKMMIPILIIGVIFQNTMYGLMIAWGIILLYQLKRFTR